MSHQSFPLSFELYYQRKGSIFFKLNLSILLDFKIFECCSNDKKLDPQSECFDANSDGIDWTLPINGYLYTAKELRAKNILEYRRERVRNNLH